MATIVNLNLGGEGEDGTGEVAPPNTLVLTQDPTPLATLVLRSVPDIAPVTAVITATANDDIVSIEVDTPAPVDPITATINATVNNDIVEIAATAVPGAITATINATANDDIVAMEVPGNVGIPVRTAVINAHGNDDVVEISVTHIPAWVATINAVANDDTVTIGVDCTEYSGPGYINAIANDDIVSGFLVRQIYDVTATINVQTNDDIATFAVTTPAFIVADPLSDSIGVTDAVTGVVTDAPLRDFIGVKDWAGVGIPSPHDYVQVTDTATGVLTLLGPLEDNIGVREYAEAVSIAALLDTVGVSEVWSTTRIASSLHDRIQVSDELTALLSLKAASTDQVGIQDTITATSLVGLSDFVGVTDVLIGQLFIQTAPFVDRIGVSDAIDATITVYAVLSDTVGVQDTLTGQLHLVGVLSDTVAVTDWVAPVEATTVHVVNAETGAVSTYTFTPRVKGMGQFQGTLFLAAVDGLYVVDAGQDEDGDIVWTLQTGFSNLGTDHLKQIYDVNCQMRTEGDTIMHVISDRRGEKESWRYRLTQDTRDSYRDSVIKPGKGIKSVYYALDLQGVGPAEIDQLRVLVRPLPRRR